MPGNGDVQDAICSMLKMKLEKNRLTPKLESAISQKLNQVRPTAADKPAIFQDGGGYTRFAHQIRPAYPLWQIDYPDRSWATFFGDEPLVNRVYENRGRALARRTSWKTLVRLRPHSTIVFHDIPVHGTRDSQEIQEGTAGRAMNSPPSKRQTLTRALFSTVIQKRAQSASASKVLDEFELYLSEPVYQSSGPDSLDNDCPSDLRFSPLGYWKVNAHRFPLLALIARELFGVPASGGEIERVFSTATDIATAKRNRIKPPLFAKMLFIKRNMKLKSPVTPVKQK
ncbi:hypothetical protein OUZ56_008975 [Daphnia magna]|uniref:HAT C-terminal dimerisation domain-containing protein n=1 Tax=Daphnia magna TaxID=35525 RepID=A0ABR0AEU7_9CRUS|nr:hypothetical protein OUZ56_008975 [Daphnia magna]